jgi:hypothetical protein
VRLWRLGPGRRATGESATSERLDGLPGQGANFRPCVWGDRDDSTRARGLAGATLDDGRFDASPPDLGGSSRIGSRHGPGRAEVLSRARRQRVCGRGVVPPRFHPCVVLATGFAYRGVDARSECHARQARGRPARDRRADEPAPTRFAAEPRTAAGGHPHASTAVLPSRRSGLGRSASRCDRGNRTAGNGRGDHGQSARVRVTDKATVGPLANCGNTRRRGRGAHRAHRRRRAGKRF